MNNRTWISYLNNYKSFDYVISIPVTTANYKNKIIRFDETVLQYGKFFGIYFFKNIDNQTYEVFIENYKKYRTSSFLNQQYDGYIKLFAIDQFPLFKENNLSRKRYIKIPEKHNSQYHLMDFSPNTRLGEDYLLSINNTYGTLDSSEFNENYFWYEFLELQLSSSSNIWWEDLRFSKNKGDIKLLDSPLDNRSVAYRITPRFNSFLRELKRLAQSLDGTIKLEEHNTDYVTSEGILLDGKIIYQEDIEEGRIKLPAFNTN